LPLLKSNPYNLPPGLETVINGGGNESKCTLRASGAHSIKVSKSGLERAKSNFDSICASNWLSAKVYNFLAKQHAGRARRIGIGCSSKAQNLLGGGSTVFLSVWNEANQICPKSLIPFLPNFVESLEKHGHFSMSQDKNQAAENERSDG